MKNIIILLFIFIYAAGSLYSQEAKFVALTVKGTITLERNYKSSSLKAGEKIYDKDKIKIGKKSYLDIAYIDGKTLSLSKTGTYTTYKLIQMVKASKTSSTKKFADYVLAEFTKSVDDINNMKVTGSVERIVKPATEYAIPRFTNILDPIVTFKWFPIMSNSYIFSIISSKGDVIDSENISDTLITVNLQKLKLTRGNNYKWFVKDAKRPTALIDTSKFLWITSRESKSIKDTINILMKTWKNYDQSIKQALLASFYYNHVLYIDMLQAYERAMELSPGNDTYKKLYIMGLDKVGLNNMAANLNKQQEKKINLKINFNNFK